MSEEVEKTIIVRDRRKPNQYTTDNVIAREWLPILRVGDALYFYSVYLSMANKNTESSWGSLRTMAQYLQCSVDLVIRGNKLLEICELIFVDSGNERTSNEYYILDPPPLTPELKARISARLDEIEAQNLGKNWTAWVQQVRKALEQHQTLPEIWQERRARKGGRPPKIMRPTTTENGAREPRAGLSENGAREPRAGYSWLTSRVVVSHEQGAREPRTEQEQITRLTNIREIIEAVGPESVASALLAEMLDLGVAGPVAEILLEKYSLMEIAQQIEWLPARHPVDPPAMLVSAIQNSWSMPAEFESAAEPSAQDEMQSRQIGESASQRVGGDVPSLQVSGSDLDSVALWAQALHELRFQMTRATFETWLQGTYIADVQGDVITIAVRSEYARDWLENRLLPLVQRTLTGLLGRPVNVQVMVMR
ncbi:MAG: DnaA N-terminal domain-containing protein [Anaerolineae bacterium]|nr:DnaA N-terminal domain-containing protein [Anaerolineae bacterium]